MPMLQSKYYRQPVKETAVLYQASLPQVKQLLAMQVIHLI
jgi:hypothetical protein